MCSAPNDGFSNQGNYSTGQHCWGKIANPNAPAVTMPLKPGNSYQYTGPGATDMWATDKPAVGINNTDYNGYIFTNAAIKIINEHPADTPLFMYIAFQVRESSLRPCTDYSTSVLNNFMCTAPPLRTTTRRCRCPSPTWISTLPISTGTGAS